MFLINLISSGNEFHRIGGATEKYRDLNVFSLVLGKLIAL